MEFEIFAFLQNSRYNQSCDGYSLDTSSIQYQLLHSLLRSSEMSARSVSKGETVHDSLPITEILFLGSKILLFPNVRVVPV